MARKPRGRAPLLADGLVRTRFWGRLDPLVKHGLKKIGREENRSMSSIVEEVIIRYFKLEHSRYLKRRLSKNVVLFKKRGNRARLAS